VRETLPRTTRRCARCRESNTIAQAALALWWVGISKGHNNVGFPK
jgi:hypothetical protein